MNKYGTREATLGDIVEISTELRPADIEEIYAGGATGVISTLSKGLSEGYLCWVDIVNDKPGLIGGISPQGLVWAVSTEDYIKNHKRRFFKLTKEYMKKGLEDHEFLWNYVYSKNVVHVKWLQRMNFEVNPIKYSHPITGEPFQYFRSK